MSPPPTATPAVPHEHANHPARSLIIHIADDIPHATVATLRYSITTGSK